LPGTAVALRVPGMLRDLRIAVRALRSWRWGALLAVLTLAVGIGTTTALYALLRVALADSAVEIDEVERVIRLHGVNPSVGARRSPVKLDDFDALASLRSFEAVAAYHGVDMGVGTRADDDVVRVMLVSPRFFEVMRGRSWKNAFVLLDEAQNATPAEIKMFLTRIGEDCTMVINGDVSQCDLAAESGLHTIVQMIAAQNLPVPVIEFTRADIVRSGICAMWVNAFEEAHR